MTILDLQRRIREAGRIRIGQQIQTSNGKSRPAKLDHFRLTSPDRRAIEAAAGMYGGRPTEWDAPAGRQWEVITEVDELDVIVPPSDMAYSAWYELWSGGGCQRRCDGITEQITEAPCVCDPDERECKPHTRLSVMLRDLSGLGVWRLDTQGYYAAVELAGAVQVVQAAAGAGVLLPARLRLEQRQVKRPGEPTRKFAVPVLDVEITPAQLLGGGSGAVALNPAAVASAPALGPATPGEQPALMSPVPPTVTERPAGTVAQQAAGVGQQPSRAPRAGGSAPIPRTGLAPRTAAQAEAGAEPVRGEPEGARPPDPLEASTVAQLKLKLKRAGLPVSGTKDELIARLRQHAAGSDNGTNNIPADVTPPDDGDDGTRPFDRDGAQKAFHATLHDLGLDYETQVRPWMQGQYGATLSKLDDGRLRKLLDAMDLRPMEFVVAVQEHAEANAPEPSGPSLAERAHAHAEGQSDAVAGYQARIREAWRVLAVHNETVYQGGWERAEKITGGRAGSSDWSGSSEAALRALAVDMERAAAETGGDA